MMRSLLALSSLLALAAPAAAQTDEPLLVLVVDPGPTEVDQAALRRSIGGAVNRAVIRMTDERAPRADGRLTIAFSSPDRWVLRYEASGQVAWASDRVGRPGELQGRLAELSRELVERVDRSPAVRRRDAWNDDVILALQNEIVDPFADDPPRERRRESMALVWSEVIDPFAEPGPRGQGREAWTEVLDPWADLRTPGR